ncbi:MAG: hypothetical protein ACLFUX_08490 [Spirochaetaceae bacterium]
MSNTHMHNGPYRVRTATDRIRIRRVILSVADKSNLDLLVEALLETSSEVELYSTGGTHRRLSELLGARAERHLRSISEYTGQKEMAGGLVKTLDYRIYLGLLADADNPEHRRHLDEAGAVPFDMTVVNLYPFSRQVAQDPNDLEGGRQNIDIGGPTLIRAAAKNYLRVAAVCNPASYGDLAEKLWRSAGSLGLADRFRLAREAFDHTARYDGEISRWLGEQGSGDPLSFYHTETETE